MRTVAVALALACTAAHAADNYPSRPIRMIVPSGAGGVTDVLGRVVAHKLGESLGQQVVIDNRPGASGIVGSQIVATAAPDGHTLLMVFPSHVVNPALFTAIPYDTVKAFAPITLVSTVSLLLTVNGDLPVKSTQELIAYAKAKPGQLNYGTVGSGSLGHLGSELLRSMSGTRITHIAYKGSPQILTALIGGEINMYMVASISGVVPQIKSGRVRALGREHEAGAAHVAGRAADRGRAARLRSARVERHTRAGRHAANHHRPPAQRDRSRRALAGV